MESKPASHVSHAGRWLTGLSASGGTANSPLAFFDLIMASAREAAQSGQYDPLPGPAPTATGSANPSSASDRDEEDPPRSPRHSLEDEYPPRYAGEFESPAAVPEVQEIPGQQEEDSVHLSAEARTNLVGQTHDGEPTATEEVSPLATDESQETSLRTATSAADQEAAQGKAQAGVGDRTEQETASGEQAEARSRAAAERASIQTDPAPAADSASTSAGHQPGESKGGDRENLAAQKEELPLGETSSAQEFSEASLGRGEEGKEGKSTSESSIASETEPLGDQRPDPRGSRRSNSSSRTTAIEALKEQAQSDGPERPSLTDPSDSLKQPTGETADVRRPQGPVEARVVATGVETRQAVKGLEQGGTAEGTASEGLSSLVQRGIQRGMLKPSSSGQGGSPIDTRQQVRMVNRVARAVESTPPGQPVRIRLNPPELGALRIEIRIEKGTMTARIEAETEVARQLLAENLPQLKERLAESQITVEKFEIELLGKETSGEGEGGSHSAEDRETRGEDRSPQGRNRDRETGDETPTEENGQARETILDRQSRNLNIVV